MDATISPALPLPLRYPYRSMEAVTPLSVEKKGKVRLSSKPVERNLLEQVAAGDQAAVAKVLDQYGDLVWSLARR